MYNGHSLFFPNLRNIKLILSCDMSINHSQHPALSSQNMTLKGTSMGLSGVFLPLVMNPLGRLKYQDQPIIDPSS